MEHKRVDYNNISTQKTLNGRIEALENEVKSAEYVCVTHALTHYNFGGALMLERLHRDNADKMPTGENRKFKIFVMRDAWGTAPKPGDVVERKIMRPLRDKAGRKIRTTAVNDMKRRGTWENDFVLKREFIVDDKGCIECTIDDAVYFLQGHGVHFEDKGAALCGRREMTSGPCKSPDGQQKHVWYWRYWEAPPWVYDKLPSLAVKKTKGRPKKAANNEAHSTPDKQTGGAEA